MTAWERPLTRSFGVLHLIYGAVGIYFLSQTFLRIPRWAQLDRYPYERHAFYFDITLEILFICALIVAGVLLIQLCRPGVILSNYVFAIEIALFVAESLLSLGLAMRGGSAAAIGMSMGAVAGIGHMGTAAQFITGYPIIALVGLNIARRRLDRQCFWGKSGNLKFVRPL
jgi:hypothetical protein